MATKTLNTRILTRIDTLENWLKSTIVLKKGEMAIATVPTGDTHSVSLHLPATVIKVGDDVHTFADLPYLQAVAADVPSWAKAAVPAIPAENITGLADFISGEIKDTDTQYTLVKGDDDYTYKLMSKAKDAENYTTEVATLNIPNPTSDINALKALVGDVAVATQITNAINALKLSETYEAKGAADAVKTALLGDAAEDYNTLGKLEDAVIAAQAVADEVQEKLAAGEFKGEKGDPGKDGSDADVTAENVEKALGYKPISDVRVNGASVVAGGAANVPIAENNIVGVSKPDAFALGITQGGALYVRNALDVDISLRSTNAALTAYNLDKAVTAAMTDGKGPAWTAAQQAVARARMGIPGNFELIEETTITEAVALFARESAPDGTPYSLAGFLCVITSPGVASAIALSQVVYAGTTQFYNYGVRAVDTAVNGKSVLFACVSNAVLHVEQYPVTVQYELANAPRIGKKFVPDGSPITKVTFSGNIPANTKITIYGVRA